MGKKKRLQMQRRLKKSGVNPHRSQRNSDRQSGQARHKSLPADPPPLSNMESLERQHAAWLARRGHAYISLAETARLWNRTPEQVIRWEQIADEHGY